MNRSVQTKRATLRDVARHAEVSVATVSRVLNASELVTQATRDRVTQAIESLGFVPSAAARTLNSGRSRTIGALVPTLDHSIFARYLDALENSLSKRGYALVVAVTAGRPDVEEQKAFGLLDMGVDGLVISGKTHSDGFNALVDRFRVPTLITSCFEPEERFPTIGYDNAAIAESAIRFLKALGHVNIAVVHGSPEVNDRIATRLAAILRVSEGVTVRCVPVSMDVAGGAQAVRILANCGPAARPTAILCLSDVQALGALFELQRQGLEVPQDISVMGFDDLEWSAVSQPTITSIQLPAAEMGDVAGAAMTDWLTTGTAPTSIALEAGIVERSSTRRLDPAR